MSGLIQSAGGIMPRQGVAKEKIIEVKTVYNSSTDDFDAEINGLIKQGYQPMPNSFTSEESGFSIVMIKTKMEVEMI